MLEVLATQRNIWHPHRDLNDKNAENGTNQNQNTTLTNLMQVHTSQAPSTVESAKTADTSETLPEHKNTRLCVAGVLENSAKMQQGPVINTSNTEKESAANDNLKALAPDLQVVINLWPSLPENIRAAVIALVGIYPESKKK